MHLHPGNSGRCPSDEYAIGNEANATTVSERTAFSDRSSGRRPSVEFPIKTGAKVMTATDRGFHRHVCIFIPEVADGAVLLGLQPTEKQA